MLVKPQINMGLNFTKMHFWSKFGDSSLNGWQIIIWTSSKWDKFDFYVIVFSIVLFDPEDHARSTP